MQPSVEFRKWIFYKIDEVFFFFKKNLILNEHLRFWGFFFFFSGNHLMCWVRVRGRNETEKPAAGRSDRSFKWN